MDINKGDIYIVTCTVTNKSYVGQAQKYITKNKQKWGYEKRWLRHIYEAETNKKGKNQLIHQMIREHGKDAFELKLITESDLKDLDKLEKHYIQEYNTIEPNGYNMTSGGKGETTHSDLANEKKKIRRKEFTEEAKLNMSNGQLGKRYEVLRRNTDNGDLPKYIGKLMRNGKHVGYRVRFNNGIDKKTIVEKKFQNEKNLEKCLENAIEHVKELQDMYDKERKKHDMSIANKLIVLDIIDKNIEPDLPKYVYPVLVDKNINGYFVFGLRDCDGSEIPRRDFTSHQNTHNLNNCVKFIELVHKMNKFGNIPEDWMTVDIPRREKSYDLPNHIRETYYKGVHSGYRVEYFIKYDENKKQVVESKCFTSKKFSMEEKLNLATEYLEEIKKKHNN